MSCRVKDQQTRWEIHGNLGQYRANCMAEAPCRHIPGRKGTSKKSIIIYLKSSFLVNINWNHQMWTFLFFFMNNGGLTLFPCVHVLGKCGQTTVSTYAKIRSMSLHSGSTTSKSSGSEFFEKRSGGLRAIRKNTSPKKKNHLALRSDCDFGWFMLIFWRESH